MGIEDVVMKLIGPVQPVGETHVDDERFENLKFLCDLTEQLIGIISSVSKDKDRVEYSIKRAGLYADAALTERFGIPRDEE